jgi:signal transduction histidine kinase
MDVTPEQIQASFERILGMVDRLTDTVEHLRTFSRDTSQEPGIPIAINEVIHSSLGLIQTQLYNHGILIDLDLTADLPQVIGHPFQLEQVFLNLLSNARDALDERTKIEEAFEKQIHIRSFTNEEKKVFVEVEDSGVGISEANQERLFEPFFTTKDADQGMGLGLSISYAIVKNHRGEIICTSQKGSKTIFQVSLPRLNDSENTP